MIAFKFLLCNISTFWPNQTCQLIFIVRCHVFIFLSLKLIVINITNFHYSLTKNKSPSDGCRNLFYLVALRPISFFNYCLICNLATESVSNLLLSGI